MSLRLTFSLALALTAITTQKLNETLEGNASSASWFLTLGYLWVRIDGMLKKRKSFFPHHP